MQYNNMEGSSGGLNQVELKEKSPAGGDQRPATDTGLAPLETYGTLFEGRRSSHGMSKGSQARTEQTEVTPNQYRRHLDGDGTDDAWSLGLNPLRDDNTVVFAALDFDAKSLLTTEVREILEKAVDLRLPLMWTQSRSGGLHAWLFLREPAAAEPVGKLMSKIGHLLGWKPHQHGRSKARGDRFFEVFPKQHHLPAGQCGNWIRLPWPGGERAQGRRGVWLQPLPPTLVGWMAEALRHRVSLAELETILEPHLSFDEAGQTSDPKTEAPLDGSRMEFATSAPGADRVLESRFPISAVAALLAALPEEDAVDRDAWLRTGMALHHEYAGTVDEAIALERFDEWSATAGPPAYQGPEDVHSTWHSMRRDHDVKQRPVTIASVLSRARACGWEPQDVATAIGEFNRRWALVLHGGNAVLETPAKGEPRFHDLNRWRTFIRNVLISVPGKPVAVPLVDLWMKAPRRRSYHSVDFDPGSPPWDGIPSKNGNPAEQDFNLWPGLGLKPSDEGSCALFLDHLLTVVCRRDWELHQWVLMWLAHIVQHPTRLSGTALALRGGQGAGKSLVGEVMGTILGAPLHAKVSRPDELTGRFNAHQKGRLLLQVEEGFWAGDKKAEGALKHMITSEMVRIEPKFVDSFEIPNYGRLLVTSNKDWVVPAGLGERRFAVLDVSDARANDLEYFGRLRHELFEKGGCARFLQYLLVEVQVDFNTIRRPPATAALLEQQLESLESEDRWLMDLLTLGELPCDQEGSGRVARAALFDDFERFMQKTGRSVRVSQVQLGRYLSRRLGLAVRRERESRVNAQGQRAWIYSFAPISECRKAFAEKLSLTPDWPELDSWQPPAALETMGVLA
jgi:hypothetical protein